MPVSAEEILNLFGSVLETAESNESQYLLSQRLHFKMTHRSDGSFKSEPGRQTSS